MGFEENRVGRSQAWRSRVLSSTASQLPDPDRSVAIFKTPRRAMLTASSSLWAEGLTICVSGLPKQDRQEVQQAVQAAGGR